MPIIDAQRRMSNMGAIRLGHRADTGKTDKNGRPILIPTKLSAFRVTSPRRDVADAVARLYGGTVQEWRGQKGPEFEVFTTRSTLPVLVPRQIIDPNYEMWGPNIKLRHCDGQTEKTRKTPCLCAQWDNHEHKWYRGSCNICKVSQKWNGVPHTHEYVNGECEICECSRPCKPTTRLSVMIEGVPDVGVFKIESHGWNAAVELPYLSQLISGINKPLTGVVGMRHEKRVRIVVTDGVETTKTVEFFVPELRFPWLTPEMLYAPSYQLEATVRAQLERANGSALALTAEPAKVERSADGTLTAGDVVHLAATCETLEHVRALWSRAAEDKVMNTEIAAVLTARGKEIKDVEDARMGIFDAEVVDD